MDALTPPMYSGTCRLRGVGDESFAGKSYSPQVAHRYSYHRGLYDSMTNSFNMLSLPLTRADSRVSARAYTMFEFRLHTTAPLHQDQPLLLMVLSY